MSSEDKERKLRQIELYNQKLKLQNGLPHLYGWPWYTWAKEFFESKNHYNFLVAANQISKSSTQIRKAIHWATAPNEWPKLWRTRPTQFWYLYPTKDIATIEFEKKWVMEFLPRDEYQRHPVYGWRSEYKNHGVWAIHFNTNVSLYFKTYAQDESHLQAGTCHAVFCDEELPEHLYDELSLRLAATDGYFHMVFTATLGQDLWHDAMETIGTRHEKFRDAAKWQVSMYDCLKYDDGSLAPWTEEKIDKIKSKCRSNAEIQRRVFGRFVVDENRKYPAFDRTVHLKEPHPLPKDWLVYTAVDIGSGGKGGHPAAMVFVGVSPDFTQGRAFLGWRGDGIETAASDILFKYQELRGNMKPVGQFYDQASKEFSIIASRLGESFTPAEKSHEMGEQILNTLFKNNMLFIYETEQLRKLAQELSNLTHSVAKQKAKDDFVDALRYACAKIPWDWSVIQGEQKSIPAKTAQQLEIEARRGDQDIDEQFTMLVEDELDAWDELYEPD
jgi:phage terminase large subunit-like protein